MQKVPAIEEAGGKRVEKIVKLLAPSLRAITELSTVQYRVKPTEVQLPETLKDSVKRRRKGERRAFQGGSY